jgi:hypothetical protein
MYICIDAKSLKKHEDIHREYYWCGTILPAHTIGRGSCRVVLCCNPFQQSEFFNLNLNLNLNIHYRRPLPQHLTFASAALNLHSIHITLTLPLHSNPSHHYLILLQMLSLLLPLLRRQPTRPRPTQHHLLLLRARQRINQSMPFLQRRQDCNRRALLQTWPRSAAVA